MFKKKKNEIFTPASAAEGYIPVDSDFVFKDNSAEIEIDSNFAAQSFWKEVVVRFRRKGSAVFGLIMILFITIMAIIGPGMNDYTYSGQSLSEKSLAPRVQGLENLGIFDGSEKLNTSTGTKTVNMYKEKGLDHIYYCPHNWDEGCDCRKPKPGLLYQAQHDLSVDLTQCVLFGDDERDILAANAARCPSVMVSEDYPLIEAVREYLR